MTRFLDKFSMEVDRKVDFKEIDKTVKNGHGWKILDREEHSLSDYIRKLDKPGYVKCSVCNDTIKYGSKCFNFFTMRKGAKISKIQVQIRCM